jgi:hypothetical protein
MRTLRKLAYVEGTKEMIVLASVKPKRLADGCKDPFKDVAEILDMEEEIQRRIQIAPGEKLEALLNLVQNYNDSHTEFERLKFIPGSPEWIRHPEGILGKGTSR